MSTKPEVSERHVSPINLKHRITGAGVLILFGALILPWMLGPPSEAKKDLTNSTSEAEVERHSTFEDEVLAELQGVDADFKEPEETVYVSKITPVDGQAEVGEPVLVEQVAPASNNTETKQQVEAKKTGPTAKLSESKLSEKPKVETEATKDASKKVAEPKKEAVKPDVAAAKTSKVDVGWVVQVELLVDKKGAKKLVDNLKLKGFEPQTTIVDTNRGKKTGTRIWLGPFEQRTEAAKVNDKLEAKMGKRGFLRVYP